MSNQTTFIQVVLHNPLWRHFDYLPPIDAENSVQIGQRVRVPFGRRQVTGMVINIATESDCDPKKLKHITEVIDQQPLLGAKMIVFYQWASDYYHYPLGEIVFAALPKPLRLGKVAELKVLEQLALTIAGQKALQDPAALKRAPRQLALLQWLAERQSASQASVVEAGFTAAQTKPLLEKQLVEKKEIQPLESNIAFEKITYQLTDEQQHAIDTINNSQKFASYLLAGVTGSGKTEVYLQCIDHVLQNNQQALVLVPEIALTPQTVQRFSKRFPNKNIVVLHSGLSDGERQQGWLQAAFDHADIVIGTRSVIFIPLKRLGIIILDEEHDTSFKQQSGFRYSARDLAMVRARLYNSPVVLGSATPSIETWHNVQQQRYQLLSLSQRVGGAQLPEVGIIDLCEKRLMGGMSDALLQEMTKHLQKNKQVLLFLNRRGYAPVLLCHQCGWMAPCERCDARMTLHFQPKRLYCHHCGSSQAIPRVCVECQQSEMMPVGAGTEQIETVLAQHFPNKKILRVDRDSVRNKNDLEEALSLAHSGEADILIGTQMLAKGHHFERLSLVAVVDADSGLFSSDFRATERMAQLIIQVAGRAGREQQRGQVIIQTHQPQHPLLQHLLLHDYFGFAKAIMQEREQVGLPPFTHFAMIRAEAMQQQFPYAFLEEVKAKMNALNLGVTILGPVASMMERKAGRYRAQLLLQAKNRNALQRLLRPVIRNIKECQLASKVRWTLDVDPMEM